MEMVRRHHVVFSIFMAQEDAQVPLTLTQRVTVRDLVVLRDLSFVAVPAQQVTALVAS